MIRILREAILLNKSIPVIGITILFILSAFAPISIGYNIKISDTIEQPSIGSRCNTFYGIPGEEWNKTYGGETRDTAYSVLQTSDKGYIIVGYTETFGEKLGDVWLIKTDEEGNEEWNQTFNGIGGMDLGTDISQTSDGGYIITGFLTNMAGPPLDFIIDACLIKTDANGNEQWNRTFGGSNPDNFHSLQQTDDGGYIITGDTWSFGTGKYDMWLLKTDDKGNEQWNTTFGESYNEYGESIQVTSDGGYILMGSEQNILDPHDMDIWLLKADKNGNMQWNQTFGGSKNDWGYSLQETNDNGFILVGSKDGTLESDYDLWVIKTDENGNEEWNQTFGGENDEEGESVKQTNDGGYIITGYTESFGAGDKDVWLIKTDENGVEQWNITFGGTDYEKARSVLQTSNEGFIITGCTYSYGAGFIDVWLIKIEPEYINHPPNTPTIDGPKTGRVGINYKYTFNTTYDDGDDVIYFVDWGDSSTIETVIPNPQNPDDGNEANASHKWDKKGTYGIRARTKDAFGALSLWSDLFPVNMPRNRATYNSFFLWLLEQFPILHRLLSLLKVNL